MRLPVDYQHITYTRDGPVTIITFNRPQVKNCIGTRTHRELVHAFDRFRTDNGAKVAVLTGAGDSAFCAGGDLKSDFAAGEPADHPDPDVAVLCPMEPADVARHNRGEAPGILGPSRWKWHTSSPRCRSLPSVTNLSRNPSNVR